MLVAPVGWLEERAGGVGKISRSLRNPVTAGPGRRRSAPRRRYVSLSGEHRKARAADRAGDRRRLERKTRPALGDRGAAPARRAGARGRRALGPGKGR